MKIPQNLWHPVLPSTELHASPRKARRFGVDFAFWRDEHGKPQAFSDRCPHMGASLSQGTVRGGRLICPFHGFEFTPSGSCVHIPANGANSKIANGMTCTKLACTEAQGFIWMWIGTKSPEGEPANFTEIAQGFRTHDTALDWKINYTRAIENQLDAAHLPFVHRSTIGAGGKSLVDGPYVEASAIGLNSWVFNRIDNGDGPASQDQLRERANALPPSLQLLYPAQWLLNISARFKNLIIFVPIDEHTTRFYLRMCHKVTIPLVRQGYELVMQHFNRVILRQDLNIISHITPICSLDADEDRLVGADRAILLYRNWLKKNAMEFSLPALKKAEEISSGTI